MKTIKANINCNKCGGMGGGSTMDALVELFHGWSDSIDKLDYFVIVALLDCNNAVNLTKHISILVTCP